MVAFDAVGPAGGAGFNFSTTVSPQTWTHVCGASATAIVITVINGAANANRVTAVTYGGVNCPLLGTQPNTGGSLVAFYGLINPPTGSNTVSVTWTTGSGNQQLGGSISLTAAGSFGTLFGATSSGASVSSQAITVNGTTTGGMIVSSVAYGGAGGTASWTYTPSGTVQWNDPFSNSSEGQTVAGGTVASTGGGANQTMTWTPSAVSDACVSLAVEVLPPGAGGGAGIPATVHRPSKSRILHHRGVRRQQKQVVFPLTFAVTATVTSNVGPGGCLLRIWVITGQAAIPVGLRTGTAAFHGSSTPAQATIATTGTGSRVYGALEENNTNTTFAALGNTTLTDNQADATNAACYATCKATSLTGTPGATTIGSTSSFTSGSVALAEIMPGIPGLAEDPSAPASLFSLTATTLTTARFAPPPGSLLVAAFCGEGDGVNTQTAAITDSAPVTLLTWAPVVFSCIAASGFSGVWTASIPPSGPGQPVTPLPPGDVSSPPVTVQDGATW